MKLHSTVVERLVKMNDIWGGHRENSKLATELAKLDVSVYRKQTGEEIVVLTEDLVKATHNVG